MDARTQWRKCTWITIGLWAAFPLAVPSLFLCQYLAEHRGLGIHPVLGFTPTILYLIFIGYLSNTFECPRCHRRSADFFRGPIWRTRTCLACGLAKGEIPSEDSTPPTIRKVRKLPLSGQIAIYLAILSNIAIQYFKSSQNIWFWVSVAALAVSGLVFVVKVLEVVRTPRD
jgi:hypothetical protein